jgi:cyanophycinase
MAVEGILIPIGGNEDKGIDTGEQYKLEYIEEGILARVVKESGGPDARIVVVPTASSIPDEVSENYLEAFGKLGCTNVSVMDIRNRKQSFLDENIELVQKANCVMFSGGDQSKITAKIGGTAVHKVLKKRFKKEPLVIAGTSAGAMCMSEEMIAGGSSTEAFVKGAVKMTEGMGFIPKLIIDSHFIRRGRFGRLAEAVAIHPELLGVGLAEDTGMVIRHGRTFEVIGSGMVIVFDPRKLKHNNQKILEAGTPMSLTNLKTHVLANGDRFNIKKKTIKVLPVDAPFV